MDHGPLMYLDADKMANEEAKLRSGASVVVFLATNLVAVIVSFYLVMQIPRAVCILPFGARFRPMALTIEIFYGSLFSAAVGVVGSILCLECGRRRRRMSLLAILALLVGLMPWIASQLALEIAIELLDLQLDG